MKKNVGYAAADLIQDGMTIGIGTGTTVHFFIERLIQRVGQGLKIQAVSSSIDSEKKAQAGSIPIADVNQITSLDLTVDGADEIDPSKRMIKGGGGALLREKLLAAMSKEMIVIVDESKCVDQLGAFGLPLEILPFAHASTIAHINEAGYMGTIRKDCTTDNGNLIYDLSPSLITDPSHTMQKLINIPGVVETGLFLGLAGRVIVGHPSGEISWR